MSELISAKTGLYSGNSAGGGLAEEGGGAGEEGREEDEGEETAGGMKASIAGRPGCNIRTEGKSKVTR